MAIGMDSTVYVTTGTSNAALYALTRDLRILWADTIPNLNTSGPALAQGVLAVAGAGTALKVYRGLTGIGAAARDYVQPFRLDAAAIAGKVRLKFTLPVSGPVAIRVFDAAGRARTCVTEFRAAGEQVVALPVLASGVGFAAVTAVGHTATVKFVAVR
jgi:hypothetical protein